jgi:hypothetical protein
VLIAPFAALRPTIRSRLELEVEILALRHQLAVLTRQAPRRPRLGRADRLLWVLVSRMWPDWRRAVRIVPPDTIVRWHRRGFALYWWWKSRPRGAGRPAVALDIRDRDGIYGSQFQTAMRAMGTEEVLSAPRAPWQNPFVERVIGPLRRECLDHVIVWNERSLRRHLRQYLVYDHEWRTDLSLDVRQGDTHHGASNGREVKQLRCGAVSDPSGALGIRPRVWQTSLSDAAQLL